MEAIGEEQLGKVCGSLAIGSRYSHFMVLLLRFDLETVGKSDPVLVLPEFFVVIVVVEVG